MIGYAEFDSSTKWSVPMAWVTPSALARRREMVPPRCVTHLPLPRFGN